MSPSLTVFDGPRAVASGTAAEVVLVLRSLATRAEGPEVLVFDDATGSQVDLDLREGVTPAEPSESDPSEVPGDAQEAERRGPGRPKLGVVGREVTLLPRHWEWLNAQRGGASVALRQLVERAIVENAGAERMRLSRDATYRFMSAMAGNEAGFEEACRSLFGGDREGFEARIETWPHDVADYTRRLAADAFTTGG